MGSKGKSDGGDAADTVVDCASHDAGSEVSHKKEVGANRGEVRSHEERGWWGGPPRGSCLLKFFG